MAFPVVSDIQHLLTYNVGHFRKSAVDLPEECALVRENVRMSLTQLIAELRSALAQIERSINALECRLALHSAGQRSTAKRRCQKRRLTVGPHHNLQ
jgi:hypothetical protein